jgi:hypothetical protein
VTTKPCPSPAKFRATSGILAADEHHCVPGDLPVVGHVYCARHALCATFEALPFERDSDSVPMCSARVPLGIAGELRKPAHELEEIARLESMASRLEALATRLRELLHGSIIFRDGNRTREVTLAILSIASELDGR